MKEEKRWRANELYNNNSRGPMHCLVIIRRVIGLKSGLPP